MSEHSILASLQASFAKSTKKDWERAASQEIEGKNPYVELQWTSQDGIQFGPYYDNEDITGLHYLEKFNISPAENSFLGARSWINQPVVTVVDELQANKISMNHLSNGADGILFNLTGKEKINLNYLLREIEWKYCTLSFQLPEKFFFEKNLKEFISENKLDLPSLHGALFWDSFPKKAELQYYISSIKNFRSYGLTIKPSSAVKEIAEAIAAGAKFFEKNSDDANAEKIFSSIAFSVPVGTDFLESIAKLKALRMLWYQVSQAYGLKNYTPANLHIHARSEVWNKKDFQPHANLIKSTSAAMAAVAGGSDSVTIYAEDENNSIMNRVARNVSNIIREEAHLDTVADPLAGSYALDNMLHAIANQAWSLFQSKMKND